MTEGMGDAADLGVLVRALRRKADLSQRQLATRSGVPQSTVARMESGRCANPSFRTVERLVSACGMRLEPVVAAVAGSVAPIPHERMRDEARRHYPAHLDARSVRSPKDWGGAWWAYWYTLLERSWPVKIPAATYDLSRRWRDIRRVRESARNAVVRRVDADVPPREWRWVAELPDGEHVGELRAVRGTEMPPGDGSRNPAEEVALLGVLVEPRFQGAGVGRRLVEHLVAEVDRVGVPAVRAFTELGGIAFLARCGFRVEASRPSKLILKRGRRGGQGLERLGDAPVGAVAGADRVGDGP